MMNKSKSPLLFVLLLLCLFTLGCGQTAPPTEDEVQPEVAIEAVEAFGTVEVKTTASLTIDFYSEVDQLYVENGQKVNEGQKLLTLDLYSIKNDIQKQQYELQRLQNNLNDQQVICANAQKEMERRKNLLDMGAISYEEYEDFKIDAIKNAGDVKNQELSLAITQTELTRLENMLCSKSYLDGDTIVSPFAQGLVCDVNCSAGDTIDTSRCLLRVMDLGSIFIEATIPEEFIGDVKQNSNVLIIPVADSSEEYHGKVIRISDMAEERDGETIIPVEISIDDYDEFMKPNYNVDVQILIE